MAFLNASLGLMTSFAHKEFDKKCRNRKKACPVLAPWCSGYHYCTTSFTKAWA